MTVQHVDTPYLAATKDITTKRVRIEIGMPIDQLVIFSPFSQILIIQSKYFVLSTHELDRYSTS